MQCSKETQIVSIEFTIDICIWWVIQICSLRVDPTCRVAELCKSRVVNICVATKNHLIGYHLLIDWQSPDRSYCQGSLLTTIYPEYLGTLLSADHNSLHITHAESQPLLRLHCLFCLIQWNCFNLQDLEYQFSV